MKNTVVIFNAGIGALTLGFQNAGYEILKAYEPDRKVIEIYQENISQNVTCLLYTSRTTAIFLGVVVRSRNWKRR